MVAQQSKAQTIVIDSTFTSDGEIFPFSQNDTIYGLSISGSVTLNSDTSLVRVILSDTVGNEWMVYEAYPMIVTDSSFDILEECDETCYLTVCVPERISVQIFNAQIDISTFYVNTIKIQNIEEKRQDTLQVIELAKISLINNYISEHSMIWMAGETPLSCLSYQDKKSMFGTKYCLNGYEFYLGGVYAPYVIENSEPIASNLVDEFDWRFRHKANVSSSPYFDNNPDVFHEECEGEVYEHEETGNGWMTAVKTQKIYNNIPVPGCDAGCTGTCYIYSSLGALEALMNLYFVWQDQDLDMSEQQILDCCAPCGCNGKELSYPAGYLTTNGIIDENTYPWADQKGTCNPNLISSGDYQIKISGWDRIEETSNIDIIKEAIITKGPLVACLHYPGIPNDSYHAMALLGFGVVEEGDLFPIAKGGKIIVGENDPNIGKLFWTFKQSYSPSAGDTGYVYHLYDQFFGGNYLEEIISYDPPFDDITDQLDETRNCYDKDSDGYCFWGIGPLEGCLNCEGCPDEEEYRDSDDANRRIGPYLSDYSGQPIAPELEVHLFKDFLCDVPVVCNGFLFVENACFCQGNILHFTIMNSGNAQLNLSQIGDPVILSGLDAEDFQIDKPPDRKIMFGESSSFKIKYLGNPFDNQTKLVTVEINDSEPDLNPFYFCIVINGCDTEAGIEELNGDNLWGDQYMLINKDQHIKNDAVLTITGSIAFTPEVDIIVEAGGKLIVNGGRLTGSCNTTWNGIDVWGDARLIQAPQYQGMVEIINGGTIEFADTAIATAKRYLYGNIPSGGVVICKDAVFKDNYIGVSLLPYQDQQGYPNFSRFTRSEFKISDDYYSLDDLANQSPKCGLQMNDVSGVVIQGCRFINESSANKRMRGSGIENIDAWYFVDNACMYDIIPCDDNLPCRFEGWDYGIKSLNDWAIHTITIDSADFIDNYRGVYMSATSDATIIKNHFELNADDGYFSTGDTLIGIYAESCIRYQIEENKFAGTDPESYKLVGMHMVNSGEEYNEIYNDSLVNLTYGIIAAGENRNEDGTDGLCLKCNDFIDCETDIYITPEGGNDHDLLGIATNQGLLGTQAPPGTDPDAMGAGNTFTSDNYPAIEYNYYNNPDLDQLNYTHQPNTEFNKLQPNPYNNLELFLDGEVRYSKDTSCPSHLNPGGIQIEIEKNSFANELLQLAACQDTLLQYVDGGDTQGLDFEIQTSFPEDALQLRQQLLDESPYLSDTVMKSSIARENVLLNAMLRDILVANPQSAKKADILSAIDDRYDPLPDYMMAEIMEGIEIIGAKEQLERNFALHSALKGNSFANIVKYYKNDTTDANSLDSLQAFLENDQSLTSSYQLALSKLFTEDTLGALSALDNIPVAFTLDAAQIYSHSRFQDLFDILIEIPSDSTGIDSTILAELVALANENDELAGIYARNMLINSSQLSYIEPVYLPNNLKKNPSWNKSSDKSYDEYSYVKVFPNPCGSFFIIEYDLRNFSEQAHIRITDIAGREITEFSLKDKQNQRIVDTRAFSEGTYLITLFINDKLNVNRKVNIVK